MKPATHPFRKAMAVSAILAGACLLGYGGIRQMPASDAGKSVLTPEYSPWDDLGMDVCARQCLGLEINRISASLEREIPAAASHACGCETGPDRTDASLHAEAKANPALPATAGCRTYASTPRDFAYPPRPGPAGNLVVEFKVECAAGAHAQTVAETWVFANASGSDPRPMPMSQWLAAQDR
jgi:hypothetical protein